MSNIVRHGFAPTTLTEAIEFSKMLSSSTMVPKQYQNKPEDILVACQWGYELGLAPMQALQNIAVINGRPSVYGDAAMALAQSSPLCEEISETIEGEGSANPVAVCTAKRKGRAPVVSRFSVEDAKRAGLWGKQGPWTQYPKRMLQMRARGFALRDAFPDVLKGLITQEEARDIPADDIVQPITVSEPVPALTIEKIDKTPENKAFPIVLPDGSIYSTHETHEEWVNNYAVMVNKIAASKKFDAETKEAKLKEFRDVNEGVLKSLRAGLAAKLVIKTKTGEANDD